MTNRLYLLINLGTPEAPNSQAIALFLKAFLNDPLVLRIPSLFRWFLVHLFIVPRRSKKVAQAYKSIWTDRGSPLQVHMEDLAQALQQHVGETAEVRWAMRYGKPSIEEALTGISPHQEIKVLPLYPQYALSSTQSSLNELQSVANKHAIKNKIQYLPYFYQYKEFTSAYADVFQKYAPPHWDHVLFSFHGLPVNHLTSLAPQGSHCSLKAHCCDVVETQNSLCYRAQAHHSAHQIAHQLGLSQGQYSITFQSRLGWGQWIQPYTDVWLKEMVCRGLKDLVVLCPSFVSDCLETLEEIKIRENQRFKEWGGKSLTLIPCLNDEASWVQAIHHLFTQPKYATDWVTLNANSSPSPCNSLTATAGSATNTTPS